MGFNYNRKTGIISYKRARSGRTYRKLSGGKYNMGRTFVNYNIRSGGTMGMERKAHTLDIAPHSPDNLGQIFLLNGIGQGTGFNQRIGNVYTMKSVNIRVCFEPHSAGTPLGDQASCFRVMCVYDRQANGTLADVTDFLEGGGTQGPMRFNNLDNRLRFRTCVQEKYALKEEETGILEFFFKSNLRVTTNGPDDTISGITTGSLFFFIQSNRGVIDFINPHDIHCRIRFVDGFHGKEYVGKISRSHRLPNNNN